jgi:hypothetical protein
MATRNGTNRVTLTWRELSELLSKAKVLLVDEEIANLTLAKPRVLLVDTERLA